MVRGYEDCAAEKLQGIVDTLVEVSAKANPLEDDVRSWYRRSGIIKACVAFRRHAFIVVCGDGFVSGGLAHTLNTPAVKTTRPRTCAEAHRCQPAARDLQAPPRCRAEERRFQALNPNPLGTR